MVAILWCDPAQGITVNVFLIGGQSNADGRAKSSDLPAALQSEQKDVAIYWAISKNGSAALKDSGYDLLRPGLSNSSGCFGPEVTFGRAMADFYATRGERVALIKHAQGGTSIATHWLPGGDSTTTGDGFVYQRFQAVVANGLTRIQRGLPGAGAPTSGSAAAAGWSDPIEVHLAGMIWMQGEADSNKPATAAAYETNLNRFIADIRATYSAHLPFVIGQLSVNQTGTKGSSVDRERVRAAQASVAAALPNTGLVVTDKLGLKPDRLHFDASGQRDLGTAFAKQMQALIAAKSGGAASLDRP